MAFFDAFKRKGTLTGDVLLNGLPSCKMYSVTITLFQVASSSSSAPFAGDPPIDRWVDSESVKKAEDPDSNPLQFSVTRPTGHYFIGIGVIAYLERDDKMFAQVERFFPMTRACEILSAKHSQIHLAVSWPSIPVEELGTYGTVYPSGGR